MTIQYYHKYSVFYIVTAFYLGVLEKKTTNDFSKELRLVLVQFLKLDLVMGWILSTWRCKAFNTKFSGFE